jgi:tRNA-modifying protein YgfZ
MIPTPMRQHFENAEALWERYGTADISVEIAGAFEHPDLEYAAIRKSAVLVDQPQRATVRVRGSDRLSFLNRMLTQELKGLAAWSSTQSFWLNRKGRIDADLRVLNIGEELLFDCDVLCVKRLIETLNAFIITEEVELVDESQRWHRLAMHGPAAAAVLAQFSTVIDQSLRKVSDLQAGQATAISIGGVKVQVDRLDTLGEIGLEMWIEGASSDVVKVFEGLLQAAHTPQPGHSGPNVRMLMKPAGWHACNIARVEAGTPMYYIDFGPTALPGETGLLDSRVSFKKGCYLGQEVVARMHALGHPKQVVVPVRMVSRPESSEQVPVMPIPGAGVFAIGADGVPGKEPIGQISSATSSPLMGGRAIGLATVKWAYATGGTKVMVPCAASPDEEARLEVFEVARE